MVRRPGRGQLLARFVCRLADRGAIRGAVGSADRG